mgnify:CR=1 FL=1
MTLLMQLTDVADTGRLEPITGAINAGEILHLVGPNGAGKRTLLARMAGLTAGAGEIPLLEHNLADWSPVSLAHRRSYLVQQQVPPFAMPVWHYLMLHLHDKQHTSLLTEVAAGLGLEDKLSRHASQLSGGEWQRVRLAAVILQIHPAGNPHGRLLLLDEPMVGLDPKAIKELKEVVLEQKALGVTVLISTHMLEMVEELWDMMFVMEKSKIIGSYRKDEVGDKDLDALFFEMTGGEKS